MESGENIVNRESHRDRMSSPLFVPLSLLGMMLAMFGRVLWGPGDQVLSKSGTDIAGQFIYWRQFGFAQLRAGHVALWDPHIFSGAPFFGGFQSALLYPPNWIYLILPLARAINCEVVLHVFLLGLFTALWVSRYRLHPLAVLLASSMVMFGGAFFLRAYAGNLPPMDTMTWAPLMLLTLDSLLDEPKAKWVVVGIFAFSMQLLAGYPPAVFSTVFTCALYGGMRLLRAPRPVGTMLCLAIAGTGALLITAAQVWSGLETASEGTRHGGVSLAFAGSFSLPPENLITLLVPGFFGNLTTYPYWGRWLLWEMCPFLGLTGLAMGFFALRVDFPHKRIWAIMALVLLWIALGVHTALFSVLYRYAPGFSYFRAPSKFAYDGVLFLALLAAFGADALMRSARGTRSAAAVAMATASLLGGLGVWMRSGHEFAPWGAIVNAIAQSGESRLPVNTYVDPRFNLVARHFAGSQCLIAGGILLVVATLFFLRASLPFAAHVLIAIGIAEVFAFARSTVITFSAATQAPSAARQYLDAHPGDYRTAGLSDSAITIGANDIWGYDSVRLSRYEKFVAASKGADPHDPTLMPQSQVKMSLLRLLRLGLVFVPEGDRYKVFTVEGGLPHLELVDGWVQINGPERILTALSAAPFDPTKTVILESVPTPSPAKGAVTGTARLLASDVDSLTIDADVPRPMLLLVTDAYSRYWQAVAMPGGGSQQHYQVLPADYTLMAVPLDVGRHLLRLEYAPPGWVIGRWISLGAFLIYLLAATILAVRPRRPGTSASVAPGLRAVQ